MLWEGGRQRSGRVHTQVLSLDTTERLETERDDHHHEAIETPRGVNTHILGFLTAWRKRR